MSQEVEVLLIEDNDSDALLIIRALQKNILTPKFLRLKDGSEALDFIYAKGKYSDRTAEPFPKFILLDLKMQKVGGLEMLKKIKSDEKTKLIPVIVLTSSKESADVLESYKEGANSYVFKTIEYEKFYNKLNEVINYWMKINYCCAQIPTK